MSYQVHVCIYRVIITLKTSWFALVHSYLDVSKLISLLFIFPWTNLLNKYKISRIRTQCNRELLLFRYIDVLHARVSRKFSNRKEGQKRPKSELRWTVECTEAWPTSGTYRLATCRFPFRALLIDAGLYNYNLLACNRRELLLCFLFDWFLSYNPHCFVMICATHFPLYGNKLCLISGDPNQSLL